MDANPWSTLRGLFPKWEPTIEETRLFTRAFDNRRKDLMVVAVEEYRTFVKWREPNLGEILKRYADFLRRAEAATAQPEDPDQDAADGLEDLERSRRRIAHDVDLLSDEDLTRAIEGVGTISSMAALVGRLPSDRSGWTHVQRGLVWAMAERMGLLAGSSSSTPPPSPSPDQG